MDRVDTAPVAIALGSNLGDRRAHLTWAVEALAGVIASIRCSPIIETEPVDVPDVQPPFLNAVVVGTTSLTPDALLNHLHALERQRGRVRPFRWAPRTLDLDLILFGDLVIDDRGITIPHPRFRERRFVLEPLATVAGEWRDPVTGKSVSELFRLIAEGEG